MLLGLLLLSSPLLASDLETARTLLEQQQYAQARPILEKALEDPASRPEATVLLTWLYNGTEDWERAVEHGEQAIRLMPDNAMAHHQYAIALRIRMTHISKIRAIFSLDEYREALARAIELDPANVDARVERVGFLINAPGIAGGDREQGAKEIKELMAVDWRMGMHMSAELEILEKRPERAIEIFEEMVSRDGSDLQAHLDLGLLLQDLDRHREAARHLGAIIDGANHSDSTQPSGATAASAPEVSPAISLMARYQRARSRLLGGFGIQGAAADLESYLATEEPLPSGLPSRSSAWLLLGDVQRKLGQADEARAAYTRAVELDRDNKEARRALRALG
jgi:tetratricopeptide (TPR) repeat protein